MNALSTANFFANFVTSIACFVTTPTYTLCHLTLKQLPLMLRTEKWNCTDNPTDTEHKHFSKSHYSFRMSNHLVVFLFPYLIFFNFCVCVCGILHKPSFLPPDFLLITLLFLAPFLCSANPFDLAFQNLGLNI